MFKHEGTIRRRGPNERGIYHWVSYHPGVKLLLGIASGSRWFSDKAYEGSEQAKRAALRTLSQWKQSCQSELDNLLKPQICLCPSLDCPNRKVTDVQGKPVRHITAWTVVHASSLEHQLGFARKMGSNIRAERAAAVNSRCKKVIGETGIDEAGATSSLPLSYTR